MLSFQELYEEAQEQVQDDSADTLTLLKRGINQGAKKFGAILNREYRVAKATFSLVANQQYYQLPEDAIRPRSIVCTIGGVNYALKEVPDDDTWDSLNMTTTTSTIPQLFFVNGSDEIGIWPIPADNQTSAAVLKYERRMRDMTQANYTTGTVEVTNGTAVVTGAGVVFTQSMVGRYLHVTDGSADGMWYKIASYVDSENLVLENNYGGTTGSGRSYLIGEAPDIPEEFHEALVDYACYRYYRRRRDIQLARDMKGAFDEALVLCKGSYSSKTGSQYIRRPRVSNGYTHYNRDYSVTGA